ncbi:hypothetical protein ACOZ38_43715 [Sphaerisporangium viridialbum]|uniref:hypothetical protein n=1 Tax=Sphaerisporangium viridialbum TaxID=46189 RepID=UPI003C78F8A2
MTISNVLEHLASVLASIAAITTAVREIARYRRRAEGDSSDVEFRDRCNTER